MDCFKRFIKYEKESDDFGFTWPNNQYIFKQLRSEIDEIETSFKSAEVKERLQEEIGDLIHAAFSLCLFKTFELAIDKYAKRLHKTIKLAKKAGLNNFYGTKIEEIIDFWKQAKKIKELDV